jgi:hypothetical protein
MSEEKENEEPRGFRVTDRRRFSESGEDRGDVPPADAPAGEAAAEPLDAAGAHTAGSPRSEAPRTEAAEINFSTFVLSLSTQALLHLGEIPDPQTGLVGRDLGAARQVIDILGILKQKTTNNLEHAEEALLESVLYDLRMRFVQLVRTGSVKEGS